MRPFYPRTSGLGLALAVALMLSPAAHASNLVIHGPASTTGARARAAQQRAQLLAGAPATEALHVSQVPAPSATPVWLVGGESSQRCTAAPRTVDQVEDALDQAIEALDALDDATAQGHFDTAHAGFICLDELVDTPTVWRYHFHRGVLDFNKGDRDAAQHHFVQAVLADPAARWDDAYNPDAHQVFLAAREQVLMTGSTHLEIHDPEAAATEVRVDGAVASATGEAIPLIEGSHLLQYVSRAGDVETVEVVVSGERPAALLSRGGLDAAILAGEDATGLRAQGAAEALAALGEARGADRIHVAADSQPERLHTFDVAAGGFVPSPEPVGADRWRRRPGPRVGIAVGGGVLAQPVAQRASRGTFGALHVGVEVRLVRGLALDLAATLGLGSFVDQAAVMEGQTNVVPLLGFGARYAFGYGVVRPYAALRFALRPNEAIGTDVGAVAAGGVVVLPHGPLRVQIEVHGGWAGMPHVAATAGAGIAF